MITNSKRKEYSLVTREIANRAEEKSNGSDLNETKVNKSSLWQTVVNLLAETEGTGILALPYVIDQGGIAAILALAIVPIICCYTGKILIECLYVRDNQGEKIRVRNNYKDIGESCWPRYGGLLAFATQVTELVLLASLYIVLCGSLIEGLLPEVSVPRRVWMAIVALIGLPTLFIKHLSHAAWFSLMSIIALTIAIVIIIAYGISTSPNWDITRIALWDNTGVPLALATIIFSYISHEVLPTVEANMKDPKQFNLMLSLTYVCLFAIKLLFALIGYLAFRSNISEVITDSIPIRALKIVVNSLLIVNTFFSYPFLALTIIHCIEDFINLESVYTRFSKLTWLITIRVTVSIVALLPALIIPHFVLMMSFIASLTGMLAVFIFPSVFHLYLSEDMPCYETVLDCLVIFFGVIAGTTGLAVSGFKLVKSFQSDE